MKVPRHIEHADVVQHQQRKGADAQPCYDFTPVIEPAFDSSFLSVRSLASGIPNSHGVTGGVYKTRERIHRSILICDY